MWVLAEAEDYFSRKKEKSFSFEYFEKPSWGFVSLIETSILARGIRHPAILPDVILVVQK